MRPVLSESSLCRSGHRPAFLIAVLIITGLVAGDVYAGMRYLDERAAAHEAAVQARTRAAAAARVDRRDAAVGQLLAKMARAVLAHDRRAYLATIDPRATAFRRAQSRLFTNLTQVPLAAWRYRIAGDALPTGPRQDAAALAAPDTWTARIVLGYRLRGFDRGLVTRTQYLTFAWRAGRWLIVGDGTAAGLHDDPEIWSRGVLRVVRGRDSLVMGSGTPRRTLRDIAARVDHAVATVAGVWGPGWSRRGVVLVPADEAQAVAVSGTGESLSRLAALATVETGPDGVPPPGTGDRIIVDPANFAKLTALGRRVVLTHELTHVATRAATSKSTPIWLVEGFADYVGYQGVDIPVPVAAQELARRVRVGQVPAHLPDDAAFSAEAAQLPEAYEGAWLACRLVAQRYGQQRLVRLYRAAGEGSGGSGDAAQTAMAAVLGITPADFTAAWRRYLERQLR